MKRLAACLLLSPFAVHAQTAAPPTGPVKPGGPKFEVYNPPEPFADYSAAEPTMDFNRATGAAHMIYDNRVLKTTWDDAAGISPAPATWTDNSDPVIATENTNLDPFLVGDEHKLPDGTYNPRIWAVSFKLATSNISFTDDDGALWIPTVVAGQPAGIDNESVAAGPYPALFPIPNPVHPHAFYYCAHAAVNAFCTRSDNGGLTYGPGVPIFPANASCNNHGHVKVGGDGTVYVPINNSCLGAQGVSISTTAGLTWNYVPVPNTRNGRWDSSIGIANDGKTVYYGYAEQTDDRPMIIKGTLNTDDPLVPTIDWDPAGAVDVGAPAGLNNIAFSTVVAGDPDRAAYAFHGTREIGDSGQADLFSEAVWYLYVAVTYDGGKTWALRDVMPDDPTQKGAICDGGIGCPSDPPTRNLLDFMDMVLDAQGRIVVGYADGCVGPCVDKDGPPSYTRIGGLARQATGKSLYAEFDSQFKSAALKAPAISARRDGERVRLDWRAPVTEASVSGYRIYRARNPGAINESSMPYAQTGTQTSYEDSGAADGATYYYRVRALYGSQASGYSNEASSDDTAVFCPYSSASACMHDKVRVARLHAEPRSGAAPLRVRFDARSSQQTLDEPIESYVFDFGDGSAPVNDRDGVIEYRYAEVGAYRAQVQYLTAGGRKSGNAADAVIEVKTAAVTTPALNAKAGSGFLIGAFGLPALLGLLGFTLLRRRI